MVGKKLETVAFCGGWRQGLSGKEQKITCIMNLYSITQVYVFAKTFSLWFFVVGALENFHRRGGISDYDYLTLKSH